MAVNPGRPLTSTRAPGRANYRLTVGELAGVVGISILKVTRKKIVKIDQSCGKTTHGSFTLFCIKKSDNSASLTSQTWLHAIFLISKMDLYAENTTGTKFDYFLNRPGIFSCTMHFFYI